MTYENATNITGLGDMFTYANDVTSGILGLSILFMVYVVIVIYMITRGESPLNALIAGGWVNAILSVFLFFLDLVDNYVMFVSITLLVVAIVIKYMMSGDN